MKADMQGKPLLDVLAGRVPARRPIWFMRQAGRYLPEYRQLREQAGSFLNLCYEPKLAAEATLQPLRRFDIDAAILFADILVVPHAMGLELRFEDGEGPILGTVRDRAAVGRLLTVRRSDQVQCVYETVSLVRSQLGKSVSLIGFCGGPWTVASYMIEGSSSIRELAKVAAFQGEDWFRDLIARLVEESVEYLTGQIEAGAEAVQIFDSWAGDLPDYQRRELVVKPLAAVVRGLRQRYPNIPVIVFAKGVGVTHMEVQLASGANAIGIESELPIEWARDSLIEVCAVQGNLDPVVLLASEQIARNEATRLAAAMPMARHIFNLGHGIRPKTRPEVLQAVIESVRDYDSAVAGHNVSLG